MITMRNLHSIFKNRMTLMKAIISVTIETTIRNMTLICPFKKTLIDSPKSKLSSCSTSIKKDKFKAFLSSTKMFLSPLLPSNMPKVLKHHLLMNHILSDCVIKSVMMSTFVLAKLFQTTKKMFKSQDHTHKNTLLKQVICSYRWTKKGKF